MKTIFVVMESSWKGKYISKVFDKHVDAVSYRTECIGSDEFYDFDSAYKYWVEEWEVV